MGHEKELLSVLQRSVERILLLFLLLWQPPFLFCWSQCGELPPLRDYHAHNGPLSGLTIHLPLKASRCPLRREERRISASVEILRCAQDDRHYLQMSAGILCRLQQREECPGHLSR